jgi:hypothetical protein
MKRSRQVVPLIFVLAAAVFPSSVAAEPPAAACNVGTELAHTLVTTEQAHEAIPLCP